MDSFACVTAMDIANGAIVALAVFGLLTIVFGIFWIMDQLSDD